MHSLLSQPSIVTYCKRREMVEHAAATAAALPRLSDVLQRRPAASSDSSFNSETLGSCHAPRHQDHTVIMGYKYKHQHINNSQKTLLLFLSEDLSLTT